MTPYRPIDASSHRDDAHRADADGARLRRQQRRRDLRIHRLVVEEEDVRLERRQLAAHGGEQRAGVAARAGDDRLSVAPPLRHGVVNVRRRALADGADLVVGRHADHFQLPAVEGGDAEALADRVLVRPVLARHRLVDDRHARRRRRVGWTRSCGPARSGCRAWGSTPARPGRRRSPGPCRQAPGDRAGRYCCGCS